MKNKEQKGMPMFEDFLQNRPDMEGEMIQGQLRTVSQYSQKISDLIKPEDQIPAWVQSKIAIVKDYLDEVFHTLDNIAFNQGGGGSEYEPELQQTGMNRATGERGDIDGAANITDYLDFDEFKSGEEDGIPKTDEKPNADELEFKPDDEDDEEEDDEDEDEEEEE